MPTKKYKLLMNKSKQIVKELRNKSKLSRIRLSKLKNHGGIKRMKLSEKRKKKSNKSKGNIDEKPKKLTKKDKLREIRKLKS